jgi:hypothetical protein
MKQYAVKEVPKTIISKVTCDDCGKDCTATYFDVQIKASFSSEPDELKTICWKCYDEKFKKSIIARREKSINDSLADFMKRNKETDK